MNIPLKPEDKEIEQLQKLIRNTPIQVDLIDKTMERFEEVGTRRYKRSNIRPKRTRNTIIVTSITLAMTFMLVVGTGFISPTMAASLKQIPGIDTIFQLAGDLGLKTAEEKGLVITPSDASDTHDGLILKVTTAMFDGTRVSLGVERQNSKGEFLESNLQELINDWNLEINGESINFYAPKGRSIAYHTIPGKNKNTLIMQFTDLKNQGGKSFPDEFELTLNFTISGIKDPFKINVPVKKNTQDNFVLTPSIKRKYEAISLTIDKLELTPITTNLTTRIELPKNMKIEDSRPNLYYELFDEKGNKVELIDGNGWSATNSNSLVIDTRFEPFKSVPKSIIIKSYKYIYKENSKSEFQIDKDGHTKIMYIPELEIKIPTSNK
ncbi:DUF4179 domain-containing protein [Paenibacillus terrae]|uniref:DUF4179 domain-containing protein n=1 Tax=Paenibacillus terrae TaxID=159743 RepID=UPI0011EB1B70|nr:DUF4179 domain-containing protein [Paenibacillus terrae]